MSDGLISMDSPTPSDKGSPEKRAADSPPEQVEKATNKKRSRWRALKTRLGRIFPRRPSEPEDGLTSPLPGIVLFLIILAAGALSVFLIGTPAPLPSGAPADQYSAERAFVHIQALAAQPRPVGTQGNAIAQAYLIARLEQLGLEPQVQKATVVDGQWVVRVENVLARLPGSKSGGKAVLMAAHYDGTPTGPGAGDDVSGVATLLECARALKARDRPLANDVVFLFSDGEEQYCKGASAFVDEHPWAKDVGLVVNVDSAGQLGPSILLGVSPDDDWLISNLSAAAPDPLGNSLVPEFYVPGDDFTVVFRDAGYPGVEIGCPGHAGYYHTALDDPAHIHLDSLQHQGSLALSLARRFGGLDLTADHRGNAVYFNVLGNRLLVHYPQSLAIPLVVLAALIWAGALVFGLRWKQVSWRGLLLGALASLLVVAVIAGVCYYLLMSVLLAVYPQYETGGDPYNLVYYWFAFWALGAGLGALLHIGLRTRVRTAELALGALLLWLALAVGYPLWVPGASWALTWPLIFAGVGLWGWFALRHSRLGRAWGIAWLALWAIPTVALVVPMLRLSMDGGPIQLVAGLLVGLLTPYLAIMARPRKWWFPALMGIVAAALLVTGHLTSAYTAERPLQDGVSYALSADSGKASWLTGSTLDPWTEQFFDAGDAGGDVTDIWAWAASWPPATYRAPAPLLDLPVPSVGRLEPAASGTYHLRVVPPSGTWVLWLNVLPYPTRATYSVDGRPINAEDGGLGYWAPPAEGFDLTVKARHPHSLTLRVLAHTLGLPAIPGFAYEGRPAWIIPNSEAGDNSTYVAKTFSFTKE